jgi:molybdate transport system substrate-binding protein
MREKSDAWHKDWIVGVRVWVERAGRAILGKGRLELLEGIDRWHSISEAARQMDMSYRHAWLLVQSINRGAGRSLVVTASGGAFGGGARLTPLGRSAISVFREVQEQLHQTAASLLPRLVRAPSQASVHVAAAVSLEEVLNQLLTDYALRQPTTPVRAVFGASDELADHLLAGSPADVFLTADSRQLKRLLSARLLKRGSVTVLADNSLAAIGQADSALMVRKPRDLANNNVGLIALAKPPSPLGAYSRGYLEQVGLYESLLPRTIQLENSRAVVTAVRAGQASVGLVYGSDGFAAAGCRVLFRVRQNPAPVRYMAAILKRTQEAAQARNLLSFLTSKAAAGRFRRCGFIPLARRRA